jgi:hypothetical protein
MVSEVEKPKRGDSGFMSAIGLNVGTSVAIAVVLIVLAVIFIDAGNGDASDEPANDAPASLDRSGIDNGPFRTTKHPCETVDFDDYEALTGMAPHVNEEVTEDLGSLIQMYCWIGSGDEDGPITGHGLDMRAKLFGTQPAAEADFEDASDKTDSSVDEVTPMDGPWDEAVTMTDDFSNGDIFVVRDHNLTIRITQSVRPIDAIDTNDAEALMTTYAKQMLTALRR